MDEAAIDTLAIHLTELSVESAESRGGHLQISLPKGNISILSAWRFSGPDWIVGSSSTESILFERLQHLVGATIIDVGVSGELNDLSINFGNESFLETFSDSGEYENWTISFGFETTYVGGPGRSWSAFIKGKPA
jgi:hypothetical protein